MACFLVRRGSIWKQLSSLVKKKEIMRTSVCSKCTEADLYGPVEMLKCKIASGELLSDAHQEAVAERLQEVYDSLAGYEPKGPSFLGKWLGGRQKLRNRAPKGLYIYGSVGGGKTMLMDLFYNCCQVAFSFGRLFF